MCKILMVAPKEHAKILFKILKKAGIVKDEKDMEHVQPNVPALKIGEIRSLLRALCVIYVGIDAKKLADYQSHIVSKEKPGENTLQCAVDCINATLKPPGANKIAIFSSNDALLIHLTDKLAA